MPDMALPNEFTVQCPVCQEDYRVPSTMAGSVVTCKACQTEFQIADQPDPSASRAQIPPGSRQPLGPMVEGPDFQYEVPARKPRRAGFLKSVLLIGSGAALVVALSNFQKQKHKKANPRGSSSDPPSTVASKPRPSPFVSAFPSIDSNKPARSLPSGPTAPATPTSTVAEGAMASTLSLSETAESGNSVVPAEVRPAILPPPGTADSALPPHESVKPETPALPPPPKPAAAPTRQVDSAALRQLSRASLEKFLLAPDLATRLGVSQHPEKVKAEMEAYYQKTPVAPVPLEAMTFLTETALPDSEYKFHLYNVSIKGEDAAIPFAVEETADGFRVDWQTFVESHDHKLRHFFATPTETPGQFRVLLRRAHYFGPAVPGQDKVRVAYSLEPPTRDETFYGWADLESLVYRQKLATGERAGWEAQSYVIVELAWRGNQETGRWVALQRIISDSWRLD